ncbi:fimbrial protein [Glaciimonas sp. Gout2]|uniref:fimbrial protein n=1 Tax=unclassified Glaciimonas TaxID=2644401 RepID=UPI002B22810E|nr:MULTISPECIES: fimbrial protein [unclassified Glaciimonas]MEB0010708.1 fimbrial protein [Glaciimonas sp. Cout2]MEB0082156.1 fimbrial protein [Glaciimonas sp. Gout2]
MIKQTKLFAKTGEAAPPGRLRAQIEKMICAGVLMCAASGSWAVCHVVSGYVAKQVQIDVGNIIIRDQPIGSVLAEKSVNIPVIGKSEIMAYCPTGEGKALLIGEVEPHFRPNSTYPNVFDTDIDGIGLRMTRVMAMGEGAESKEHLYPHTLMEEGLRRLYIGSQFKIEVIKTGPIPYGGELKMGRFTNYYTGGEGPGKPMITTTLSGRGITIIPASCTLDPGSKTIQVDMPKTALTDFKGAGTAGPSKSFDIVLNCSDIGNENQDTYMQFDTPNAVNGLVGVAGLTIEPGVAQGIGIQLLDNAGAPIAFATPQKMGAHTGEAGQQRVRLQAAYFQISNKPTVGVANGAVTFTLSYK